MRPSALYSCFNGPVMIYVMFAGLLVLCQVRSNAQVANARNTLKVDPTDVSDTVAWERKRYIPSRGMLQDFKKLFRTLHGSNQNVLFSKHGGLTNVVYDSSTNTYYDYAPDARGLQPQQEVFGWHPHWMKDSYLYYPYHLLSTIAFVSYDINPEDGTYNDADAIRQWLTTAMIDSAKQHNTKVLLTLTCYGASRNDHFLSNEKAWVVLSDSVRALLRQRKADGIDLDFNGIEPGMKQAFFSFVSFLRNKLGDSTTITLQVPYYTDHEAYDFQKLKPLVNTFIIQGYDHDNRKCGGRPVPPSPLFSRRSTCASIERAVDYCLGQGLEADDIVVSMPLYGAVWKFERSQWSFVEYIPYEDVRARYGVNNEQFLESSSGSTFIRIGEGVDHAVVWYEGEGSLKQKFQWIKDRELGGAGLWGLGYDGALPEIWNSVKSSFGTNAWRRIQPIGYDNGKAFTIIYKLQRYRKAIGVGISIIVCFFIAGLLFSCLDWRVRDAFFHNNAYSAILAGAIVLLILLVVYLASDNSPQGGDVSVSAFCYGLLVGGGVVYVVKAVYLHYRGRLD